jgi:hypothetical protein
MLICSVASGPTHTEMLNVMAPTVRYYAMLHKMDSLVMPLHRSIVTSRPPAWDKIVVLYQMLKLYDTVMWIDADAIIVDPFNDIRKELNPSVPMHLVFHRKTPNTGVWICKNDPRTFEMLEAIWNQKEFINHPWWEQAALMEILGYEPREQKCTYLGPTTYTPMVRFLGWEWNSKAFDPVKSRNPIIIHYLGPKKINLMKADFEQFLNRIWVTGK